MREAGLQRILLRAFNKEGARCSLGSLYCEVGKHRSILASACEELCRLWCRSAPLYSVSIWD